MPPLSNPTRSGDAVETRPAVSTEIEAGVSILLAGAGDRATDEQVQTFVSMAASRGLNLNDIWVAIEGGQVRWAMLPVVSPGRTMLLLSPPRLPKDLPPRCVGTVIEGACEFHRRAGVQLAQLLIDPAETSLRQAYVSEGFIDLAELIYLQREVRKFPSLQPLPAGMELANYSAQTHDLFVSTIARSYEKSLDCPGLSGLRDMEDVILGHKGTGEFDPAAWFLLSERGQALGILLLGLATHADAMELVYLGLVPEARGRGLGDLLMNLALVSVVRHNRAELTLAVDSRNTPAMQLYFRHGLKRIGSRAALIRDLDPIGPKPAGTHG